jgi:hypothetical protein
MLPVHTQSLIARRKSSLQKWRDASHLIEGGSLSNPPCRPCSFACSSITRQVKDVEMSARIKEVELAELKKIRRETERRIRDYEKLYDLVKNQRNKFVNLIQARTCNFGGRCDSCAGAPRPCRRQQQAARLWLAETHPIPPLCQVLFAAADNAGLSMHGHPMPTSRCETLANAGGEPGGDRAQGQEQDSYQRAGHPSHRGAIVTMVARMQGLADDCMPRALSACFLCPQRGHMCRTCAPRCGWWRGYPAFHVASGVTSSSSSSSR